MVFLKQSTAVDIGLGPFVDATDGVTPETGLTISQADVRLKKNGGSWAQKNQASAATHEENGWYEVSLNTTDTDTLGTLLVAVYETGALPVWREFQVVPANVYDSLVGGSDTLQADVTQFGGANGTFSGGRPEVNTSHIAGSSVSTTTAQIGVNVVQVSGDATAADNLEAAADGTGYNLGGGSVVAASVTGAVGSVASGVTVSTNNDKTGYGLANNAITAAVVADGAIDRATFAADTGLQPIRSNTAQAGAAGTITLDSSASATDDLYNDCVILITGGTGVGQARLISDYVGSTKVASVAPNWATNPSSDSTFAILPGARADLALWLGSAPNALSSGRVDSTVGAMASGVVTAAAIATDAIDADALAADAVSEIQSGLSTLTAAGVRSAVGLASANLDTQLDALPTAAEIADAVWDESTSGHTTSGTFGEQVKTDIDAILDDTGTSGVAVADKTGYRLSATGVDDILDEAITEPSGVFTWNGTLRTIIGWLGALSRNRVTMTATTQTLRNDANSGDIATSTQSDDGTTYVRGEWS